MRKKRGALGEKKEGEGAQPAEKGSSITADKRERIMIRQEEKERVSQGGRAGERWRKAQGKNRVEENERGEQSER